MKTISIPAHIIPLLLLPVFFLCACKDEVLRTRTYQTKVPVFVSMPALRAEVIIPMAPQELSKPGKIYIYGDYLFISEANKGIHIVDNTNPALPRFINFINIPGNVDMAVNSNILYADNYSDLLAIDISDPTHILPAKRVEDVFNNYFRDNGKGLIIGYYKDTVITEVVNEGGRDLRLIDDYTTNLAMQNGESSYGTGGSTARFTLMNDYLYTVNSYQLKLFNVKQPSDPAFMTSINIGGGIETIFPYQDKLFIGSTTGMHIYNAANPAAPVRLSTYRHVTSCDPVVVQGKYAYVTLRSGNFCQQGVNLLEVLNIEDAANPKLVSSFQMLNPHGLSISNSTLFICEGKYGLKAFNSDDVLKIGQKQLSFVSDIEAVDVISGPKSLIITGGKGIYQYDYSNPSSLKLLSKLMLTYGM